MKELQIQKGLETLNLEFGEKTVQNAIQAVKNFNVEIPSWIFGDFGAGRFGDYTPPGHARNIFEKLDDAGFVHKLTGATPDVAVHVLWDLTEDGFYPSLSQAERVAHAAQERGIRMGSISPTYFLKGSHRNSLAADEKDTADRYIDQTIFAAQVAKELAANLVTIWLPDGSNYPGQINLKKNYENVKKNLVACADQIDRDVWVLIEYKVFEPGTYSTTIPDWGTAYTLAKAFGENAGVLVDMGHHFHSANIEQIVSRLVAENLRCGFHFNTRYAADDDHAVEPSPEMARIFYELVSSDIITNADESKNWAYMIDQASGRENRIHAILHSVDSLQQLLARACLVNQEKLAELQNQDQVILANRVFNDALLYADPRPIVAAARLEQDLPADPVQAFVESGYQEQIESDRK